MFCPKCGTQILEEAKFCQKCGMKLIVNAEDKKQKMLMEQGTAESKESQTVQFPTSKITKDKDGQEGADNEKAATGKTELFGNKHLSKNIVVAALLIFVLIIVLASPLVRIVLTCFGAIIGVIAKFRREPKKLAVGIGIAIVAAIVATAVFGKNSGQNDKYVLVVKNGTLEAYSQKTVGKAFDDYLGNPKWESGISEDGVRFVNVTGEILYYDKETDLLVQFIIENEKTGSFSYNACELNGVPQNNLFVWGLLEAIYNDD